MLRGIDLAVPEGAIYALVGANGAGKTTMIKLLMNILRPTAGHARCWASSREKLAGKAFNRIGYVSENQDLPDAMTVASDAGLSCGRFIRRGTAGSSSSWCGSSICRWTAS